MRIHWRLLPSRHSFAATLEACWKFSAVIACQCWGYSKSSSSPVTYRFLEAFFACLPKNLLLRRNFTCIPKSHCPKILYLPSRSFIRTASLKSFGSSKLFGETFFFLFILWVEKFSSNKNVCSVISLYSLYRLVEKGADAPLKNKTNRGIVW